MQVWIMMKGEFGEGGGVLGVYADRDLAHGQFAIEAGVMDRMFGLRNARQEQDGSLHLEAGCDWLSLEPYDVVTQLEIEPAR